MGEDSLVCLDHEQCPGGARVPIGWLGTMPLWLIPGAALVLPILLAGLKQSAYLRLRRAGGACDKGEMGKRL